MIFTGAFIHCIFKALDICIIVILESLYCPSAKMLSLGDCYNSDADFWKRCVV